MFSAPRSIPWFNAPLRSFRAGWSRSSAEDQPHRHAELEAIAQPVHQEAAVGCVHACGRLHWMAIVTGWVATWYA